MKILMVHNDYAAPSGEEKACEAMAGLLQSRGHEVRWFRRSSSEISGISGNVKVFFSGIFNPCTRRAMARCLDEFKPDIVQIQNLYPLLSPSILKPCVERGIRVVMRCPNYRLFCPSGLHLSHGQVCERCLGPGREWWCLLKNCEGNIFKSAGYALRNAVARWTGMITNNVSVFVVLSEFQKARFMAQGIPEDRIMVVPNMIPQNMVEAPLNTGTTVSFLGRLSPEKGFPLFVEAARLLADVPFAAAGATRDSQRYLTDHLPPNMSYRGFLSGKELEQFAWNSRIIVVPGIWFEGFPNTIAEVMAAGKPVVATNLGAVPEIVENGVTGLLFEPANGAELARKIRELYNDPARCRTMGEAGRRKAGKSYSADVVYARWMACYGRKATA